MSELDKLIAGIKDAQELSRARKNRVPAEVGAIDIRIAADGVWHHEGRPFLRLSLAHLFSTILHRKGDEYYLLTPAEQWRIQVDDAPFVATMVEQLEDNGRQALIFTDNFGDKILADKQRPIRVETDPVSATPRPYIHCRDGLEALISRSAFFDLANLATESKIENHWYLTVTSMGEIFTLGRLDG